MCYLTPHRHVELKELFRLLDVGSESIPSMNRNMNTLLVFRLTAQFVD